MFQFQKKLYDQLTSFLHLNTSKLHPLGFKIDYRKSNIQVAFGENELLKIFMNYFNEKNVLKDYEIAIKHVGVIYKEHVIEICMQNRQLKSTANYLFEYLKFFDGGEGTDDCSIFHVDLTLANRLNTVKFFKNMFDESEELISGFDED
ncbi:MAG: hypothetical protein ACC656_07770 [Candidatus Heimdallarchaeota archaeon]